MLSLSDVQLSSLSSGWTNPLGFVQPERAADDWHRLVSFPKNTNYSYTPEITKKTLCNNIMVIIYIQSVLIYGTETWVMKADDLRSLERTERMMVRWMCGVSLKDRKRSEDLCNLLGINCVADVVRRGRLRWFGHLERKSVDDWVSACRGLVVEGTRGRGRSRKTWEQCVRDDMKLLGLHPEWAVFRDMWRDLIWGKRLTLA